ncbi:hypothetical protein D3C77_196300 [compost metagenome]
MDPAPLREAWLPDHIHMAWRGSDIIVLDLHNDAYACLIGAAEHVQGSAGQNALRAAEAILDDLEASGLICRSRQPSQRRTCPPPSTSLQFENSALSAGAIIRVGANAVAGGLAFRKSSLVDLAVRPGLARRGALAKTNTSTRLAREAGAFCTVLPWLPFQGRCLHRSYLLRRLLARSGVEVDWVFGVRTWPFMAHCWLQIGDTLLADDLDRVRGYTPILVA